MKDHRMLQHSYLPCRPPDGVRTREVDVVVAPQVRHSIDGDISDLLLSGDIDMVAVQPLLSIVGDKPCGGTCRVHTGEVTFIDCAGLGSLISLQRHVVDHDAVFEIADPGRPVVRLLQLTDPDGALLIRPGRPVEAGGAPLDGTSKPICGRVEPVGAEGEWRAVCDIHDWRGITHRSHQQAQLDLTGHRANTDTARRPVTGPRRNRQSTVVLD